jgi:hypothetical protein
LLRGHGLITGRYINTCDDSEQAAEVEPMFSQQAHRLTSFFFSWNFFMDLIFGL